MTEQDLQGIHEDAMDEMIDDEVVTIPVETTKEAATMGILEGKVCIITGGASGLGTAIAERFAQEGGKIVIADIDHEKGRAEADYINANGGEAVYVPVDVRDSASVDQMVADAVDVYGRLDIAVNCAARIKDSKPIAEMDINEYDDIININLKGVVRSMRSELKQMMVQGEGGSIVNVSAVAGLRAQANVPAHAASKHALIGLTKSAAMDYSPHAIRVNVVAPGAIKTPMVVEAFSKFNFRSTDYFDNLSLMGRAAEVEEVANAICWLASDRASFVTGTTLPIDGGFTSK